MADKTKRVDGEDLTADCFLIVGDPEDTSTWKLPWKFSTDEKTKSHLRNAVARFDQLEGVSADDKKKAMAKLKKLCKEYGIEISDDTSKGIARGERKRQLRFEIKALAEDGTFEGLLSPYGNVDAGGDVVEKGAFSKTLQEHGNTVPLLWQHRSDMPIGELVLEDRPDGLWAKGRLLLDLPEAKKAYLLIKAGIVKGLSIGFQSVKDAVQSGVRYLKEVRLFEGSIVTFPMNESALIASVKARAAGETKGDFAEELSEIQLRDADYQMRCALFYALNSLTGYGSSDVSREEKLAAAEAIIQQFSEAYLAWLPSYLDMLDQMYEMHGGRSMERKAGRMISSANREKIQSARDHMKSADDIMAALVAEEAAEDDPDTSKGRAAAETKSEPGDHSAVLQQFETLITEISFHG